VIWLTINQKPGLIKKILKVGFVWLILPGSIHWFPIRDIKTKEIYSTCFELSLFFNYLCTPIPPLPV